jgi:8-oxo-dGTP diphosphatase
MKNTKGIAVIIENKQGEFLLHLRDEFAPHMKNQWCLLGGKVENDEDIEETACREILEEIGINVTAQELNFFKKIVLKDGLHESFIFHILLDLSIENITLGEGKLFKFFTSSGFLDMTSKLEYSNSFLKAQKEFLKLNKK